MVIRIKRFFVSLDRCWNAQWERGASGFSLRVGPWLFAAGSLDYREKSFPSWCRLFGLSIHGARAVSMSNRPTYYLYLFGRRIFDTTYWTAQERG